MKYATICEYCLYLRLIFRQQTLFTEKNDIRYRAQYQMLEVTAKPFVLGFTLRLVKLFDVSLAKLWAQLFKRLPTLTLDEKK